MSLIDSPHASVGASVTQAVLHAAQRLGLERGALLAAIGLEESQLADPDARVPFAIQERLWELLGERIDHPEPGLALGQHLAPGPFSVLGYLLQSSPTLSEALAAGLRYQRLVGEGGELCLEEDAEALRLIYRPLHPGRPATRTRVLALMSFWVRMMAPLLDDFRLLRAEFGHPAPAEQAAYRELFACELAPNWPMASRTAPSWRAPCISASAPCSGAWPRRAAATSSCSTTPAGSSLSAICATAACRPRRSPYCSAIRNPACSSAPSATGPG